MTIIDSQVHAYEANTAKRPWHSVPNWPDHVTGDEMVAAMDKVGVDGAIFISAFGLYQYDASYAVKVQQAHPGRFAIVKPVNPDDPAVADVIADWKKTPGAVGIRIMLPKEAGREPNDPGLDRILRAAARHDLPVNILFWGNLDVGTALIDRHSDTRFIIDHLGILQPRVPPAPPQPWADLPKVLELAKRPWRRIRAGDRYVGRALQGADSLEVIGGDRDLRVLDVDPALGVEEARYTQPLRHMLQMGTNRGTRPHDRPKNPLPRSEYPSPSKPPSVGEIMASIPAARHRPGPRASSPADAAHRRSCSLSLAECAMPWRGMGMTRRMADLVAIGAVNSGQVLTLKQPRGFAAATLQRVRPVAPDGTAWTIWARLGSRSGPHQVRSCL